MFDDISLDIGEVATNTEDDMQNIKAAYMDKVYSTLDTVLTTAGDNTITTITSRFSDAVPIIQLAEKHIVVVGAGGIGSPTVKNLVAMGARNLTVIDDDTVEAQNVGTQFHKAMDIGMAKVDSLHDELLARYLVEVTTIKARVNDLDHLNELVNNVHIDILIGAVDNMEFRNTMGRMFVKRCEDWIYGEVPYSSETRHFNGLPDIYIDCRMSLGLWHVYVLPIKMLKQALLRRECVEYLKDISAIALDLYAKEALFPQEEGMQEPCTARALGYTGENIASYVASLTDFVLRKFNNFDQSIFERFINMNLHKNESVPFKWRMGFDARNFMQTVEDPYVEMVKADLNDTKRKLQTLENSHELLEKWLSKLTAYQSVQEDGRNSAFTYTTNGIPLVDGATLLISENGIYSEMVLELDRVNSSYLKAHATSIPVHTEANAPVAEARLEEKVNYWQGLELMEGMYVVVKGGVVKVVEKATNAEVVIAVVNNTDRECLTSADDVHKRIRGIIQEAD